MAKRSAVVTLTVVALLVPRYARADDARVEPLVNRVKDAIDKGIGFLREKEAGTGDWDHVDKGSVAYPGGWTCLATLALLNAGVKPSDPMIQRSLRFIRNVQSEQTYVVSLQTMVLAEINSNEDRQRIQNNVDWLLRARVMDGAGLRGWTYNMTAGFPDNSNTQYALLGLHAGHTAGAKIDRQVWASIRDYYVRSQLPDGSWPYRPDAPMQRFTMTTAGLCGLIIAGMELNAGREQLQANGTALNCGIYEENGPAIKAMNWIGRNFVPYRQGGQFEDLRQGNNYYSLYGLERAGRLSGQRFFGDFDWYREGCQYLVEKQNREEGYWSESSHDSTPIISTSFALLFLAKGRMPILISKLVHGPGVDWNNDRNDARNLSEWASKNVFKNVPLAWQVFDTRRLNIRSNDDIMALTADLLQSPIVYFNGHHAPRFTDVELKLLKQYVEQGGFIFAEACCGRHEFDEGFRALIHELFPDNPLRKLPAEHAIWHAHAVVPPGSFGLEGIEHGCKTVVVYSPEDLSCFWENRALKTDRGQLAFEVGGNIIAYATGMEPPQPRLSKADVIKGDEEGKRIPRGYLKVAQLRHDGDWQPAPNAMRNLMDHLRKETGLNVALQTQAVRATEQGLADYRFLYMHGRGLFDLTPAGIQNLRLDLETGGLLFADACCGKAAFDTAFRELCNKLFPDKKLEPIPLTDDLYSQEVNGKAIRTVRCRTEPPGPNGPAPYREVAPYLEGIRIGSHWVVIYSKFDIGCALEKHQSTDCLGHDHASALRLGTAAVLYALRR
jgi:hypothetical protein